MLVICEVMQNNEKKRRPANTFGIQPSFSANYFINKRNFDAINSLKFCFSYDVYSFVLYFCGIKVKNMNMKNFIKTILALTVVSIVSCNSSEPSKDANEKPTVAANPPAMDIPSIIRNPKDTTKQPKQPKQTADPNAKYDLKTSKNPDGTWGYSIWKVGENHAYINQPHKPGVSGIKGFETEEKAIKAGNFVIFKIKQNIGMPRVTTQELDSLGVLN